MGRAKKISFTHSLCVNLSIRLLFRAVINGQAVAASVSIARQKKVGRIASGDMRRRLKVR